MALEKVLYTAKVHTEGRHEGCSARSDDGRLDVKLSPPATPGEGTNPEQLFAAGWSACYLSALRLVSSKQKVVLSPETAVDAEVDLGMTGGGYALRARLKVHMPGVEPAV